MTCGITRPTAQDLFNKYLNMFSTTVLGGATVIPESNEWYAVALNYAVAEEFYAISEQAWKARDPREACCDDLIDLASVDGVYPKPAAFSQGYMKITGTADAPLPVPLSFTVDGQNFVTASDSTQTAALDAFGEAVIRVRATVAGTVGNISVTTGTLDTVVANVNSAATVCGGAFCSGAEAETCEAFRSRYLSRLQYQPRATNAWIMQKLLEWPCSTRAIQRAGACCQCSDGCDGKCGCKDCGSDLSFYLMFDGSFDCGVAPQSLLTEAEQWMFGSPQGYGLGQVEIGVCGRIVPVTGVQVSVTVDVDSCLTGAQVTQVQATIREYFTTVEPSQPLGSGRLQASIANIIGDTGNYTVEYTVDDATLVYSQTKPRTATSLVYDTGCDLEPECDVMLCLNTVTVNRPLISEGGCA